MLVERVPGFGFDGGHRGVLQQPAQLGGPVFGQASATDFVPRVIRSRVKPGKGDERIRVAERHSLQGIGQGAAHQGADSHNGFHTVLRC
jgi:hypothetical protein